MTLKTTAQQSASGWNADVQPATQPSGLSPAKLCEQNARFNGTGGVSQNNCNAGFCPAYQESETGETVVSRFADGSPAPVHVLDGLPSDWVVSRDADGRVSQVLNTVIAGFVRDGEFYTRQQAAQQVAVEAEACA